MGSVPRIASWLAEGLNAVGWSVEVWPWGKRSDSEGLVGKVFARSRDAKELAARIRASEPDFVVIKSGLDWKSVTRDIVLARSIRPYVPTVVLHPHGSQSDRLMARGDWLFKVAVRSLLVHVDGVFVLSSQEREALERFRPETSVQVVDNPYDPACLGEAPRIAEDGRFRVLFVGRLVRDKGVFELVEAAADVDGKGALETTLVGDGPVRAALARRVADLGLADRVTFLGAAEGEALAEQYRHADVLALPSYSEGFPTVVSEAMGFGLPIVCTGIRGLRDHLEEGRNALFVETKSAASLRAALVRLKEDPALATAMGLANRELVRRFEPSEVAERYKLAIEAVRASSAQART